MSGQDQVFRFFKEKKDFLTYVRGGHRGPGLHGIADLASDTSMFLRLRLRGDSLRFALHVARPVSKGLPGRLFGRLRRVPGFRITRELHAEFTLAVEAPSTVFSPDLAELMDNDWKVTLQALTENRIHVVVYKRDERLPALVFSGTVE